VISPVTHLAESSSSGLGAFQLNLKDFIIQLVTFVLVFLILRKWVIPKLAETVESRRQAVEQSLANAKATEEALAKARRQADDAIAEAKQAAAGAIADAEAAAAERASHIIKEAEVRLGEEREKLRQELRQELTTLVADATEKIIDEKLDAKRDMSLIERAIRGAAR
jgi:F-type H+-transporting ATPase subunit b